MILHFFLRISKKAYNYSYLAENGGHVEGAAIMKYPIFPSRGISVNLEAFNSLSYIVVMILFLVETK